ncbi:MAG: sigma-70 family RNA polymerase sigma factor [Limisphaerales bacterium]
MEEEKKDDSGSANDLLTTVYEELRRLAAQRMARESPGQTLQATALVHEVWLRLGGDRQPAWQNKAHFFGAAAEAMRRILIDKARRKKAVRHGGGMEQVPLEGMEISCGMEDEQLLALHEALEHLAQVDAEKAELVKLRFFAGLSIDQAAKVLGISEPTAKRYWAYARAWLYREMNRK